MTKKLYFLLLLFAVVILSGCSDYNWDKPDWLGESIYDELQSRGNFGIYLGMVNDLGQGDFLKQTGSVTVFVADDNAYRAYFKEKGIDESHISMPMKKHLVNATMLGNAYVLDMLTNESGTDGISKGQIMRRTNTKWSVYDSIPQVKVSTFPKASVSGDWWKSLRDANQSAYNIIDNGSQPMVHFIWRQMQTKGITSQDFSYLFGGKTYQSDDVYIDNVKVRESNVTCQNGYINIMDGVPEMLPDMATYLEKNGQTSIFSNLINRFSAPFTATAISEKYKNLHNQYAAQDYYPTLAGGDSIYERHYFYLDANGNGLNTFNGLPVDATLKLDPAKHDYIESGTDIGTDMGAIFAPTDSAMYNYWNSEEGAFLRNIYPGDPFVNVPNNVLMELLNNHIQYSFLNSLPSKFANVLDDAKDAIGLNATDIVEGASAVCDNGAVYVMNKVYAPATFRSVIAPTLVSDNMKIIHWAIENLEFKPYLLSMVSYYDFLILTDKALEKYIDPVSYSGSDPRWFHFYYDEKTKTVQAYSYKYDKSIGGLAGCKEEDMKILSSTRNSNGSITANSIVENRLNDLLDFCIIPKDIQGGNVVGNGSEWFNTKTTGMIHIQGAKKEAKVQDQFSNVTINVSDCVKKDNGYYYQVDQMIEPTFNSLLDILQSNPQYSEFLKLLLGNEEWTTNEQNAYAIIKRNGSDYTLNQDNTTVKTFNSFQYTVYVPDNDAMQEAFKHGLPTWDDINNLDKKYAGQDVDISALKKEYTQRLLNFIKYHFQDYAIMIGGDGRSNTYETAALIREGSQEGMSYTIDVTSNSNGITIKGNYVPSWSAVATVNSTDTYSNQLAREYSLNGKTADGIIKTSSWVVVHHITQPLFYNKECLCLEN